MRLAPRYFNPPDEEGEDYEGGRDYDELFAFAKDNLGPGCSASTKENCSEEQLAELEEVMKMNEADRTKELEALVAANKKAQDDHDEARNPASATTTTTRRTRGHYARATPHTQPSAAPRHRSDACSACMRSC